MIRINGIRLNTDENETDLRRRAERLLGVKSFKSFRISKKSIDARKKNDIHFVYSVDVETENEEKAVKRAKNARIIENLPYSFPKTTPFREPVVIVGSGPAGLMCGLTLAKNGFKVIIIERGKPVGERTADVELFWKTGRLDPNSNVQFGEGGAGTFSDGKLTTGINDFRIKYVLEEFHAHGAPEEITYLAKPHIGTDNLCEMVASIRRDIIAHGGEVRFSSVFTDFETENGKVSGAVISSPDGVYTIKTSHIVLATGHSARDTFEMLKRKGVPMERKSFSVGARIEHKQEMINKAQYGDKRAELGAADYKLSVHLKSGRGVYTFCMCPGGVVVASASEEGGVVTNGMSRFSRDGENANSALLVSVTPDDFEGKDVLAGMYLQREIEKRAFEAAGGGYKAPAQTVGEFLGTEISGQRVTPTYRPGVVWTRLDNVLPRFVTDAMREALPLLDKKLNGFADGGAVLTAPETRSSSPVRILRGKETLQSSVAGLYPCGEGAGYAGGIMSAAADGVRIAEKISLSGNISQFDT